MPRARLGAHAPGPLGGVLRGARRVAEALVTPLVPEDYLDLIDPLRAGADLRGRIIEVRPETPDAVTVVIRPGRGWLGHVPGQYIRIGIDIDGVRHWRAYSLTHRADGSPAAGIPAGCVAITTKAIPDGKVSNHLVRATSAGTLVMLDQATGDFTLPSPSPRKGPLPHRGQRHHARHGDAAQPPRRAVRRRPRPLRAHGVRGDLRGRAPRRMPGTRASRSRLNLDDEHGILDLARLDALVPDWRERETWLCGPTGLLDAAEAHWDAAGVADRLHTERFRPTVVEPGEGGTVTFLSSDARSRPTAARPSSTRARRPASSCRAAAGWASASAAS